MGGEGLRTGPARRCGEIPAGEKKDTASPTRPPGGEEAVETAEGYGGLGCKTPSPIRGANSIEGYCKATEGFGLGFSASTEEERLGICETGSKGVRLMWRGGRVIIWPCGGQAGPSLEADGENVGLVAGEEGE